jgi:hypothetical protein
LGKSLNLNIKSAKLLFLSFEMENLNLTVVPALPRFEEQIEEDVFEVNEQVSKKRGKALQYAKLDTFNSKEEAVQAFSMQNLETSQRKKGRVNKGKFCEVFYFICKIPSCFKSWRLIIPYNEAEFCFSEESLNEHIHEETKDMEAGEIDETTTSKVYILFILLTLHYMN